MVIKVLIIRRREKLNTWLRRPRRTVAKITAIIRDFKLNSLSLSVDAPIINES